MKSIFKNINLERIGHNGKAGLWTHGLDAWTLDAGKLGLWTTGRLDPGRLNAWTLDAWTLNDWTLRLWKLGLHVQISKDLIVKLILQRT